LHAIKAYGGVREDLHSFLTSNRRAVHQVRRKYNSEDSFDEKLEQDFDHFPKYHMNILVGDLMKNWGERIYSNPQLGMRVYFRLVIIMVLE